VSNQNTRHGIQSVHKSEKKVKTGNYSHVELIFIEQPWQEWVYHLPAVFVKQSCDQERVKITAFWWWKWIITHKIYV